jgi:hypothetical protein
MAKSRVKVRRGGRAVPAAPPHLVMRLIPIGSQPGLYFATGSLFRSAALAGSITSLLNTVRL